MKREVTEQGLITLDRQWSERFTRERQLWERRLGEAVEVLRETLDYLPYPSGMGIVSKNQAQIRERINAVLASQTERLAQKKKPI